MKKALLAVAFVAIAMVSGGVVAAYRMDKGLLEVKGAAPTEVAETVRQENRQMAQAEAKAAVQADEITFSCDVPGCMQSGAHRHGLCGIDGCTQIGEHGHDICGIAGCTETGGHQHNGEYCYPHRADDGHAYHNCGVSGCTEVASHAHNSCGVSGCMQTGEHSHGENSRGHHGSGHHGGGHH